MNVKTLQAQSELPVLPNPGTPIKTWYVYLLQQEGLKNRSDIEGFNTNTSDNSFRTVTMSTFNIYEDSTDKKIGDMAYSHKKIECQNRIYSYCIENNMYNIYDELIIPNHSTGHIFKQTDRTDINPYKNVNYYFPFRNVTQDIFGRKVVITKLPDNPDIFGKLNWKVELYNEEF